MKASFVYFLVLLLPMPNLQLCGGPWVSRNVETPTSNHSRSLWPFYFVFIFIITGNTN
jgi:hypothetical protein